MKISVLCFDVGSNAAGRADLLARLLVPLGSVEVIGPASEAGVWGPVASGPIRYTRVAVRRMPVFAATMADLARRADGDLIYASKTRLASAGVGYLKRIAGKRPLLLDIDDWEVGFYLRSGFWGTVGRALNLGNPSGLPWTWLCERLTALADGVTVASRFLQQRFGGTLIPHVRDTDAWKPGCANAADGRRILGAGERRVVMFLGTPREYKGLDDLAAAVASLGRADVALAVVGTGADSAAGRRILRLCPTAALLPWVPFEQVPTLLSAGSSFTVAPLCSPSPGSSGSGRAARAGCSSRCRRSYRLPTSSPCPSGTRSTRSARSRRRFLTPWLSGARWSRRGSR